MAYFTRVALILALMAFTAVVVIYDHHIWGVVGFTMAIIASLAPVKSDEPDSPTSKQIKQ